MDYFTKIIESLPESDKPEFYLIIQDSTLSEKEKEILVGSRLEQILPREQYP